MIKKFSKKKKVVMGVVVVAIIGLISISAVMSSNSREKGMPAQAAEIQRTKLVNYVNVSGTVKSSKVENVYTTLTYQIKKVNVKLGDFVEAGTVLAELDTSTLKQDVEATESAFAASETTTKLDLQNKQRAFENAKFQLQNNMNIELINAEKNLEQSKIDLENKQQSYEYNKFLFDNGEISSQEFKAAQDAMNLAEANVEKAQVTYENTAKQVKSDLKRAESELRISQANANNKSQRISLEKQKDMLRKGKLVAPVSGTITLVNATVGNMSNGVLFVIEDTNDLEISTAVKEVDVAKVAPSLAVEIKSDSTGDKIIKGTVVSVAPAAKKGANGETISSNDVSFETKVKVTDVDTGLRIGMNARLSVILEQKDGALAVPYEAIMESAPGKNSIFIAVPEGKTHVIREVPVTIGMETDFYTEVSGKDIKEKVKVITNPGEFKAGDKVFLAN